MGRDGRGRKRATGWGFDRQLGLGHENVLARATGGWGDAGVRMNSRDGNRIGEMGIFAPSLPPSRSRMSFIRKRLSNRSDNSVSRIRSQAVNSALSRGTKFFRRPMLRVFAMQRRLRIRVP